jgi:hypothetical protein
MRVESLLYAADLQMNWVFCECVDLLGELCSI